MRFWQLIAVAIVFTGLVPLLANCAGADSPGLVGHWKLAGDTRDDSDQSNHGKAFGVDLTAQGPGGNPTSAVRFDGRASRVEIANHKSLQLGSDDFSIALWVNTARELDDVLGDLLSKYDPVTRRGFSISIQNYAGVTSSQSNYRHLHFGIDNGSQPGEWTDHGRLGDAVLIFGMTVYDGQLFAGTCEAGQQQSGRVFRYDGEAWADCGSPDKCNAVSSLAVHDGKLYVGVSKYRLAGSSLTESQNPNFGGTVYRYDGDDQWTPCGKLSNTEAINGMAVYRGRLFAGTLPSGRVHSIEIGRNVTYDYALPSGWVHLAAVRDANRLRLHVDGKLVATSPEYSSGDFDIANGEPLQIGFGAHDYFNGQLSDVRVYNRTLTAAEIVELAQRRR